MGRSQLDNLAAYAHVYRAADPAVSAGLIVTHWCPGRFLQNSAWDTLAWAAVAMAEGSETAREQAFRRFVERHYHAAWNERWAQAFDSLYAFTPTRHGNQPVRLPVPWDHGQTLAAVVASEGSPRPDYAALGTALDVLASSVRRHAEDFAALRLSVAYLEHLFWREERVRARQGTELEEAVAEVAARDAEMATALRADWSAGRPGDPLALWDAMPQGRRQPADWMHGAFLAAARFSGQRSGRPPALR